MESSASCKVQNEFASHKTKCATVWKRLKNAKFVVLCFCMVLTDKLTFVLHFNIHANKNLTTLVHVNLILARLLCAILRSPLSWRPV